MTSREYFVDITIMNTNKEEFEQWEHVKSFVNVMGENFSTADTNEISFQITKAIRDYERSKDD